jgi:hypothetical protein
MGQSSGRWGSRVCQLDNRVQDGLLLCPWSNICVRFLVLLLLAGTLAAALPGGVRDAGVRAVDRAEAGLRRWALFVGGAGFLFRVLLWH